MTYFLDIAETGNMTKSSERLHIAQPSLSRSLHKLESELGVCLFHRGPKGMALTSEGAALREKLSIVASELEDVKAMFKPGSDALREVRIAVSAASEIAARSIGGWMKSAEGSKIVLRQEAKDGPEGADIVIASDSVRGSAEHMWFEERVLLAMVGFDSIGPGPVSIASLADLDFISLSGSYGFHSAVMDLCARKGLHQRIVFESNNPHVVREMIGLGLGVGFWPEKSWGDLSEGLSLVPIEGDPKRSICVSLTMEGGKSDIARRCYTFICDRFAGSLTPMAR